MVKEIDTRDFSYQRGDDQQMAALATAAAEASRALPGTHTVSIGQLNTMSGTPASVVSSDAPVGQGSLVQRALDHVNSLSGALGFAAGEPAEFLPDPHVQRTSAGSAVVHLHQQFHGIPVFQMSRTVRFSPSEQITDVVGDSVSLPPDLDTTPRIDAVQAVTGAANYVAAPENQAAGEVDGWGQAVAPAPIDLSGHTFTVQQTFSQPDHPTVVSPGPFAEPIPARLVIFYQGPTTRLGWHVLLTLPGYQDQYAVIVAADRPQATEVLYCKSTMNSATVRGSVFTESPGRTPRAEFAFPRPAIDYPELLNPRPASFPADWCFADLTEGNNVRATLANAPNPLRGRLEADKIIFAGAQDQDDDQKVVNIFYFCNYMHDFLYLLGFDEEAGNFQVRNPGDTGLPGDSVIARSHPVQITGTATMSTPRDGVPPQMNMGLVSATGRHTAFDADVVFHEYVHGLTNRLVGGRLDDFSLDMPQSRGLGEGWSDYFALTIQNYGKSEERVVTGDWVVGNNRGIRGFPYDENFPDHCGKIGTGRYHLRADGRPQVHNIGEIWCATLMQMNRKLGAALNSPKRGHVLGWQIVVDGLKLTAANPSFLDARDAILRALADLHTDGRLNDAEHAKALKAAWESFAKFGMGPNARSQGAAFQGIVADFSVPTNL